MPTETAEQAYKRNTDQISVRMQELFEQLKVHGAKQEIYPNEWGLVVDLMSLNETLAEAILAIK